MGEIFSIFSSDSEPEVIYVNETSSKETESDEDRKKAKRANLSGYSNINTSHKGYLEQLSDVPNRKTLLGE